MKTFATIRRFKAGRFSVSVNAVDDYDVDMSFDETGEVRRDIENGRLMVFAVVAKCYLDGIELASDYLVGCIYSNPFEFMDHVGIKQKAKTDGCNYGSCFSDMVRNVIAQARKTVSSLNGIKVRTA